MILRDLFEKRMSPRVYQKVFGRLGEDALIGFEIEFLVTSESPLYVTRSGDQAKSMRPQDMNLDEIMDYFEVSRSDVQMIDKEYGRWVAEQEDEFFEDNRDQYMEDHGTERAARRAASNDFSAPGRDVWFKREFRNGNHFINEFGLSPKYGWNDDQVYTQETDALDSYSIAYKETVEGVIKQLKADLGLTVKYNAAGYDSWKIVQDTSIKDADGKDVDNEMEGYGLELISPPLKAADAFSELERVMSFMNDHNIETNFSTGLHVNISIPKVMDQLDKVKLVLFMGDAHALKMFGRATNQFTTSQARRIIDMIEANDVLPSDVKEIQRLADDALKLSGKYSSVNFKNLPKYLEFRVAGGENYHQRVDDIKEVMGRWLSALEIATDPAAEKQEYIKKLVKLLDKTAVSQEQASQQGMSAEQWFMKYNPEAYQILVTALDKNDKVGVARAYIQLLNSLNTRWINKRVDLNFSWRKQVRELMKQHGVNLDAIYANIKGPTDWLDRLVKELRLTN